MLLASGGYPAAFHHRSYATEFGGTASVPPYRTPPRSRHLKNPSRAHAATNAHRRANEFRAATFAFDECVTDEALAAQPDVLEKIREGKVQAAGAVIGAVMKAMKGQADAARVRELVIERVG